MASLPKMTTCLWFDGQAEDAARFYTGIFPNSKISRTAYYSEAGREHHGHQPGSVLTVEFELDGLSFIALNGGPLFKFTPAMSILVNCDTQAQVDHLWNRLREGGEPAAEQCGWLQDRFGVSWQIVPRVLGEMMADPDKARSGRVTEAMMKMKKLDIAGLERAYAGS